MSTTETQHFEFMYERLKQRQSASLLLKETKLSTELEVVYESDTERDDEEERNLYYLMNSSWFK